MKDVRRQRSRALARIQVQPQSPTTPKYNLSEAGWGGYFIHNNELLCKTKIEKEKYNWIHKEVEKLLWDPLFILLFPLTPGSLHPYGIALSLEA